MPWDNTKTTEDGDGTVDSDEQLTASEWNQHVTDGHFPSDKFNLGTDANGNPVFTDPANGDQVVWRYDPGAGQWEIVNVNLELNNNDVTNAGAVDAKEADITNETFIRLSRESDTASTSAGTFVSAFDTIVKDSRGEGNTSGFNPNKTGEYLIIINVEFGGNTAQGDTIEQRIFLPTAGVTVNETQEQAPSVDAKISSTLPIQVSGSGTHDIQVTNYDSSFKIVDAEGIILRNVVHP